jgi:hypothetical protein
LVRGALLSARFYADAYVNPLLPYGTFGTVPIDAALRVLIDDGNRALVDEKGQPNVDEKRSVTRWPTRLRAAGAIGSVARQQLNTANKRAGPRGAAAEAQKRDATGLTELAKTLAETAYPFDPDPRMAEAVFAETVATPPKPAGPTAAAGTERHGSRLGVAENWHIDVSAEGSATRIVATVDFDADRDVIAHELDPRKWAQDSIFWYRSTAIECDRVDATGGWRGVLREVVAGMAIFTVDLGIDYQPEKRDQILKYWFIRSPDPITKDDGTIRIEPNAAGGHTVRIEKVIDFADNPFGGPSALDLLAPSYMASWLRVQQDQWMARLTNQRASTLRTTEL